MRRMGNDASVMLLMYDAIRRQSHQCHGTGSLYIRQAASLRTTIMMSTSRVYRAKVLRGPSHSHPKKHSAPRLKSHKARTRLPGTLAPGLNRYHLGAGDKLQGVRNQPPAW